MCVYLIRFEACEAEHPDLVDDMLPVVSGALLLQTGNQLFSHLNDAVSHTVDLLQPGINDSGVKQIKKWILEQFGANERWTLESAFAKIQTTHWGSGNVCVCVYASISTYHSERRSGVLRMVDAILAPFIGGLE